MALSGITKYDINMVPKFQNSSVENNQNTEAAALADESLSSALVDSEEKLVGLSADGDTAKASKEALESLDAGIVVNKTDSLKVETSPAMEEKAPINENVKTDLEKKISNLSSFTANQLDAMFLKGQISRYDYDKELERREKISEESKTLKEEDEKDKLIEDEKEKKEAASTIDNSSKDTRSDAENNEDRKKYITEEIERNDEFASEMNSLEVEKEDIELKTQNMQAVIDNDREEIMDQIYNGDPTMKLVIS